MSAILDRPRPRLTDGPQIAAFFRRRLRHVEGPLAGTPLVLQPWQCDDLDLIYEIDERGDRMWRRILYGVARGNGKTPLTGGCGLAEMASRKDAPKVFAAAGAKDQARLLLDFVKPSVESGPLRDFMTVRANAVLFPKHRGVMRILSADGDLQHGLNTSAALFDELHVFKTPKQEELYFALATSLKRPYSWEMAITTAGWSKLTLLGEKFDAAMEWPSVEVLDDGYLIICRNPEAKALMIWRGAPDDADVSDPETWRRSNPGEHVTMDYLRMQAAGLPSAVFRRLHLNQWTEGAAQVIPPAAWDAGEGDSAIPLGASVALAVNVHEDRQSAALTAVMVDGEYRRQKTIIFEAADPAEMAGILKEEIRAACARWRHRCLAYDPWQFGQEAAELEAEGVRLYRGEHATAPGMPQTDSYMAPASQFLFDVVTQGRLLHDGERDLRRQVLGVQSKTTNRGAWRIARPAPDPRRGELRVDGAFSLAMALYATAQPEATPGFEAF